MIPQKEDLYYVDRIQNHQDGESFGELYQRHFKLVHRIIAKIVLDESVAEELAQDSFVKALSHIHSFRKHASFKTWICKIAVNTAQGYLRKQHTAKREGDHLRVNAEGKLQLATPQESLFWKEELQRVSHALECLSPLLRTSLVLTAVEGLKISEAAQVQSCSATTMYWRVHQARKQLKEVLDYD